jgi:hypothetical protein
VSDIFDEVEEQLRSDRYLTIAKKTWPYAAGVAAVALAAAFGVYGWDKYQAGIAAKASEAYGRGLQALGNGDKAMAERTFGEVAKSGPRGYRVLALMQEAGLKLDEKKPKEAMALLEEAAGLAPDKVLADSARLKAAYIAMDSGEALPQLESRLTPLTAADRPYHIMAREALAMARLVNGKTAAARTDFNALTISADATETARARAQAAVSMIDSGAAATLPEVIKAARAMPEPAPTSQLMPGAPAAEANAPAGAQQ